MAGQRSLSPERAHGVRAARTAARFSAGEGTAITAAAKPTRVLWTADAAGVVTR
jgi:hypothetical protein